MNTKRFLVSNAIFILLTACGSSNQYSGFDTAEKPIADSIAIKQLINPSEWKVYNDKALVYSPNTDDIFFVYSLPDFEFLYSFGKTGQGPGEFSEHLRLTPKNNSLDDFYIDVYNKKELRSFSLQDKQVDIKPPTKYTDDNRVFSSRFVFSDDLILSKSSSLDGSTEYLYLKSLKDNKILDSVVVNSVCEVLISDNKQQYQKSELNPPLIHSNGRRVAVFYTFTPRIELYDVSKDNKFKPVLSIGPEMDQTEITRIKALRENKSSQKGIITSFSTAKYIYNLEVDLSFDSQTKSPKILSSKVYIYDWDGNQVKLLELPKPATNILVSPDDSKIYTFSKLLDMDQIYVYSTGL